MENMHLRGVVHCDIKPENLLLGAKNDPDRKDRVHLVDFGLAHDSKVPPQSRGNKGTVMWMSIKTMRSMEQMPVDDLESLAYVLIYLVCGRLPWEDMEDRGIQYILRIKEKTPADGYCIGLPEVFSQFLTMVKTHPPTEVPNYDPYWDMFTKERQRLRGQPPVYAKYYEQHLQASALRTKRPAANSQLLPATSLHQALEGRPLSVAL
jgi:casein kinase 1